MPDATFVLKEPTCKEPTLIYLFFRFNNQRLKYSTGEKIHPKFWNKEKQRAKETKSFPTYASLNVTLDNLTTNVKETYRELVNANKTPTPYKLKDALDMSLFKEDYAQKTTFLKFISELIKQPNLNENTLKQWKQTFRKLQEYKSYTKKEVDFDTIDMNFYNGFINFLTKENYTKNSIGGFIKNVKIFMNKAVERNLTKNLEYRNKRFKMLEEQVDKIYLSQKELLNIYEMKLTGIYQRLDKVRDLFIVACYTGLRFSDLIQVRAENIINDGTQIKIRTEKTSELVIIPLHKFVKNIIKKYKGHLPSVITNQKMNQYLKEIGELAEINETIKIAITRGGKTENDLFKKWELITTHTARRSFATNAFLMDVPTISIMKITGHRTEKSFMKYIRISQEENANKLLTHPFFN
ncbi:site-specific integrase [Ginsengibacter hankyongi]|uniref:Site-specific integrase n=1 Tax=Ginsengibacter hankyongi TaxID=2607284 RepID=A0A5J5IGG8_9BACT|nr:site-specific integrase [Ginsengibacter hankyongi]KAA9038451.1 site-specific integrase [Ginsengibacter hankyongi]